MAAVVDRGSAGSEVGPQTTLPGPSGWVGWLSRGACALPEGVANRLARFFGWIWYWLCPIRLGVARRNVARVFAREMSPARQRQVVRECCAHQALNAMDILRAPLMSVARSDRYVHREGFHHLDEALGRGRGAIVFMAHYGSMDLMGFSQAVRGLPVVAVVRTVSSPAVHAFVTYVRERTGLTLLPPRGSAKRCLEALASNHILALIVDQHMPPHRGIVCDFLGHPASTTPAPIRFARQSGAPLFGAVMVRHGLSPHHTLRVEAEMPLGPPLASPEEDLLVGTQAMNEVVGRWIREHPAPWLWMHRRWKVADEPTRS